MVLLNTEEKLNLFINDFNKYMEFFDNELNLKGFPIEERCSHSQPEISKDIGKNLDSPEYRKQIVDWYEKRYGERLKCKQYLPQSVLLIRNIPYLIKYTLVLPGTNYFPFIFIQDITEEFLNSLTEDEQKEIALEIKDNLDFFYSRDSKIITTSLFSHLKTATDLIISARPNYGLSQWSSWQLAEMAIKLLVKDFKLGEIEISHNLIKLRDLYNIDKKIITNELLNCIQSNKLAACRYSELEHNNKIVSLKEAVIAHKSSIELCKKLSQIKRCEPYSKRPSKVLCKYEHSFLNYKISLKISKK